jgi:hypothetical protein
VTRLGGLLQPHPALGQLEHRLLHHVSGRIALEHGLEQLRSSRRLVLAQLTEGGEVEGVVGAGILRVRLGEPGHPLHAAVEVPGPQRLLGLSELAIDLRGVRRVVASGHGAAHRGDQLRVGLLHRGTKVQRRRAVGARLQLHHRQARHLGAGRSGRGGRGQEWSEWLLLRVRHGPVGLQRLDPLQQLEVLVLELFHRALQGADLTLARRVRGTAHCAGDEQREDGRRTQAEHWKPRDFPSLRSAFERGQERPPGR